MKKYVTGSLVAVGTNSIWNDNCEYDSLLDKDVIVDFDGKGGTIAQLKPIMSTLMSKLSNDAVKEHDADMRPYSVCRSGSPALCADLVRRQLYQLEELKVQHSGHHRNGSLRAAE